MAKNYMMKEMMAIVNKGDVEERVDIGRRYPLTSALLNQMKGSKSLEELLNGMPDYVTAGKVEKNLKSGITDADSSDADSSDDECEEETATEEVTDKKTSKKEKNPKTETEADEELNVESMTAKQVYDICKEKGIKAKSNKKADLVKAYKDFLAGGSDDADAEDEAPWADDEEKSEGGYEDMSAKELFTECKSRKIKVEPKKPVKYYIDKLVKDDAKKAQADDSETETESEDDDWEI